MVYKDGDPVDGEIMEDAEHAPATQTGLARSERGLGRRESDALAQQPSVDEMVRRADKQIEFRQRLTRLIAAKIDPAHIVMFGDGETGQAYFTKAACQQILGWTEVDFYPDGAIDEHQYQGKDGVYIIFETRGTVVLPGGRKVRVVGNRSTNDDFFGRKNGRPVPLDEVDIASVRLACITNVWNHALEATGFKPSLKDLTEAGIDLSKLSTVKFRKGGESASAAAPAGEANRPPRAEPPPNPADAGRPGAAAGGDKITDAQGKRLFALAMGKGWDTQEYRDRLAKLGFKSDRDIPRSRYEEIVGIFEKGPGH